MHAMISLTDLSVVPSFELSLVFCSRCAVVGLHSMRRTLSRCTGTSVSERSNSHEVRLVMMENNSSKA